jgi:hypothetical protein
MPLGLVVVGLVVLTGLFWRLGLRSFNRRAVG